MNVIAYRNQERFSDHLLDICATIISPERAAGPISVGIDAYWKLKVSNTGVGSAKIRFLPCLDTYEYPFVELLTHSFQGPSGKWYIENCPSTIDKSDRATLVCPACAYAERQWRIDRRTPISKMRRSYVSNILVVDDLLQPEARNNVYLYRYGRVVFGKIKDYIENNDHDPTDLEDGSDFIVNQKKVAGFPDLSESHFTRRSYCCEPEQIENYMYDLSAIIDPLNFKSHAELTSKLESVIS